MSDYKYSYTTCAAAHCQTVVVVNSVAVEQDKYKSIFGIINKRSYILVSQNVQFLLYNEDRIHNYYMSGNHIQGKKRRALITNELF